MASCKDYFTGILIYLFKFGSIGVFLYDVYSDYYLGYTYAANGDKWYAGLTLSFALLPSLINSLWTTYTYYTRSYGNQLIAYPVVIYPLCFCLQGQLAGALIWLCHAWTDFPLYQSNYMQEILFSCIGITVYIEVVLESLPQLCLQLYIVITQGYWTTIQLLSITGSIMGAGLGLSTLIRKFSSQLLACIVNTIWVLSRALTIAMIGSVKKYLGFVVMAVHYLFVTLLCFCDQDRMDLVEKVMASAMSSHNIYTPLLHPQIILLSVVTAIEIIICSVCGYFFGEIASSEENILPPHSNLTVSVFGNQSIIVASASPSTMPLKEWQYASPLLGLTIASSVVAMLLSMGGRYGEHREIRIFKGWKSYSLDQPTD